MDSKCAELNNNREHQPAVEAAQENSMGTMPMGKLLLKMSLPMMFSMLVQSL